MTSRYIAVAYLNRSGSTLLMSELNATQGVCAVPEAPRLVNELLANHDSYLEGQERLGMLLQSYCMDPELEPYWTSFESMIRGSVTSRCAADLFFEVMAAYVSIQDQEADLIFFKGGRVFDAIRNLKLYRNLELPVIGLLRDPRAVFSSQKRTVSSITKNSMQVSGRRFSYSYKKYVRDLIEVQKSHDCLAIRYEDLVNLGSKTLLEIVQFSRLEAKVEACRVWHTDAGHFQVAEIHRRLHPNIGLNVSADYIDGWMSMLKPVEIWCLESLLDEEMREYGYIRSIQSGPSVFYIAWYEITSTLKWAWNRVFGLMSRRGLHLLSFCRFFLLRRK